MYARKRKRHVIIIDALSPEKITVERGNGLNARAIPALEHFNTFAIKRGELRREKKRVEKGVFGDRADKNPAVFDAASQLPASTRDLITAGLIPWYVCAERMAATNQRLFHAAGVLDYTLAALAVVFVAITVLFPEYSRYMFGLEFLCLSIIVLIVAGTDRNKPHQKWIESRFLSERLRSAFYISACGLEISPIEVPPYFGVSHQSDDWMVRAFEEVWNRLPRLPGCANAPCEPLREFVLKSWVQQQIDYHKEKSEAHHFTSRCLKGTGLMLFAVAMLAALTHFFAGQHLKTQFPA
jgi:hypothetical protein